MDALDNQTNMLRGEIHEAKEEVMRHTEELINNATAELKAGQDAIRQEMTSAAFTVPNLLCCSVLQCHFVFYFLKRHATVC